MRLPLIALFVVACQGDPSTVNQRVMNHSMANRAAAMKALSGGLDAAFSWLKDHPSDQAGALARARAQLGTYFTADEADAFRLYAGPEVMIYLPPDANHVTVWVGRTENHLIVEPSGLSPGARAKVGAN